MFNHLLVCIYKDEETNLKFSVIAQQIKAQFLPCCKSYNSAVFVCLFFLQVEIAETCLP